jgi:hypothetical protein
MEIYRSYEAKANHILSQPVAYVKDWLALDDNVTRYIDTPVNWTCCLFAFIVGSLVYPTLFIDMTLCVAYPCVCTVMAFQTANTVYANALTKYHVVYGILSIIHNCVTNMLPSVFYYDLVWLFIMVSVIRNRFAYSGIIFDRMVYVFKHP